MKSTQSPNPELAVSAPQHLPVQTNAVPSFNIEAIFQLAIEKQGTADTLEKLMGIRRELNAENAKRAFDAALSAFQAECPVVLKRVKGAKDAYKFAPLDEIMPVVQPLLSKHGFSFSITSEVDNKWVKAICKITHRDGHFESGEFKVPTDERNPMMNDPQRYGGSLTFAKRYAFCNAFGIMTGDEDRDAARSKERSTSGKVATDTTRVWFLEQTKDIHVKLKAYGIDLAIIMPNQSLEEWPLDRVPTSKAELNALRKEVEAHK